MSVATLAHPPSGRRTTFKLWLAMLALIAAGIAIAWIGAGSLRAETTASGIQFRTVEDVTGFAQYIFWSASATSLRAMSYEDPGGTSTEVSNRCSGGMFTSSSS